LQCVSKFGVAGGEVLKQSLVEEGTKEQSFKRDMQGYILPGKSQGHAVLENESALGLNNAFSEGSCLGPLGAGLVPLDIVV
jgi:hypothetical protein